MRLTARNRNDVEAALQNSAQYRDVAISVEAIRPDTPEAYLTEARHALQSAIMPRVGERPNETPVRRQREMIRALDLLGRAAVGMGEQNPIVQQKALAVGGHLVDPSQTPEAAVTAKSQSIAAAMTKPVKANDAFFDKRFVDHVRATLSDINDIEASLNVNGPSMTSQALAIQATGALRAAAYAHEAANEGASLSARMTEIEFVALREGAPEPPHHTAAPDPSRPKM
ncbi:MAG: hypothetical protein KI792_03440 [Alphaproteobacteria bacterium]|nr:hypothetical protein [Alphaproteobacteria bacterium SS10]